MKSRSQIDDKYKWNLDGYFKGNEWNEAFDNCEKLVKGVEKYDGKLKDEKAILGCFKALEKFSLVLDNLVVYAHIRLDEDVANSSAQELVNKIDAKATEYGTRTAFIVPQLSLLSDEFLTSTASKKEFKDYNKMLLDIVRERPHNLNESEEKLMSGVSAFTGFRKTFSAFENGDLKFNNVVDSKGKSLPFDMSKYHTFISSDDRKLREAAYREMNGAFGRYNNFLTSNYLQSVNKDNFYAKARKFESCFDKAMFYEEVDPKVYDMLVNCIHSSLPIMQKYYGIKAKLLGYKKFYIYDVHAKLGKISRKFTYDEAIELVKSATSVFGKDYNNLVDRAKNERWIDVMPNSGKRSGAYSWGTYTGVPVVLTNFDGTYDAVSTLAHELGHSMHSYFSNKSNPYFKSGYTIFCAEVASTVNEILLVEYMLKNEKSDKLKKLYLENLLTSIQSTIYRQTMFSEFEDYVHKCAYENKPLSSDILNRKYMELNRLYFGKKTGIIDEIKYEWSRIPHFYTSYYVYKYATGLISAITIVKKILNNEPNAVENYFKFLRGGCSDTPTNLLKKGGVDLTDAKTYEDYKVYLKSLVDRLAKCNKE